MNYDLALVSAVLETRDLGEALKEGVKVQHLGDEAQQFWDLIMDHHEMFHEVPSIDYFQGICPGYEHRPPADSIPSIVHELKTRHLHSAVEDALQVVAELNSVDPWEARLRLMDLASDIAVLNQKGNTDLVAGEDKHEVFRTLERLQQTGGLLGFPWPWEYLNKRSIGLMPGNFVYLYGREKCKKTWILLYMALFWEALGLKVLMFTKEMGNEELAWRLYCLAMGFDIEAWSNGEISTHGKTMLEDAMDAMYEHRNLIFSEIDGGMAAFTAKVDEIKPDIIIHDYMIGIAEDEMIGKKNPREHEYAKKVANQLKAFAMKRKIPVIACGHANKEGVKLKGKSTVEVAHSDHISRKVDYLLRVVSDDANDRTGIIINAGRNIKKFTAWTMNSRLCNGFGEMLSDNVEWIDAVDDVKSASEKSKQDNEVMPPSGDTKLSFKPKFGRR
jgi:hypothetical protein